MMAVRDGLLAEFDHEIAATTRVFRSLPDHLLAWTPHERCRSVAQLTAHMIDVAGWAPHILDCARFDLDHAPHTSAAPASIGMAVETFNREASRARMLIDRTEGELCAVWSLLRSGQELFTMPRSAAFRTFVLAHLVHHRGQLSVYLRLAEITVPPIYGPTADSDLLRIL
jgi:uncharacterized damage-inducible protein DinB